jgi:ribosomal protein S8
MAKLNFILQPRKLACEAVLQILWKEGYILGYQVDKSNYKKLKIFLKYKRNKSVINSIKKVSNTGHNIFYSICDIWKIRDNNSIVFIFTSKGIKSITVSNKFKIGGQPFILIN